MTLRPLVRADLPWVIDLAATRRQNLRPHAPRFWRPATTAEAAHREHLGALIDNDAVLSVRTDHGFLFAIPHGDRLLVDDLAVSTPTSWPTEGVELLRRAATEGPLRIVCPVPEADRRRAVELLGATLVESWWHRDLDVVDHKRPPSPHLAVDGAEGRLVEAPPVYDPGGPVLLVTKLRDAAALTKIERAATAYGAPVSVVSLGPHDPTELVTAAGYRRTTDFYETA